MAGKKCVGIASDKRYGLQNQTVACDMRKTFKLNDKTLVGLTGLASDMQTLEQKFVFRSNMYKLREERDMSPVVFSNMVSSLLYEKRFGPYFCEPVICGLARICDCWRSWRGRSRWRRYGLAAFHRACMPHPRRAPLAPRASSPPSSRARRPAEA